MKTALPSIALGLLMAECVTMGGAVPSSPWIDATQAGACAYAAAVDQQCRVGIELDSDKCLYARVISRVCAAAEGRGVLADRQTFDCARRTIEAVAAGDPRPECADARSLTPATPTLAGSGYAPRSRTVFYRAIPGGPEKTATGDPSADPWRVACAGKSGSALAACVRSRFFVGSPAVCAEYARAFGVDTCGTPAGGWARGPSNERWGSALAALNHFCENDPAVIGSTGRAGGWDCESTAVEWAQLGAFGGEPIVTEWQRRSNPPPPILCPNGRIDAGETCVTCPADAGACPPPPPPDPRLDCSSLRLPPPGAAQFVAKRAGTDSTGLAAYELLECRGGSLPIPEPPRPALSAVTRATLASLCGWIRSDQPTRRRRCAAAVAEVFSVDALAMEVPE